ncbi:MAG: hypothetical protein ACI399_03660 [Candidatus Cryptobacteroides sp.]
MKKVAAVTAAVILLALLSVLGINFVKNSGPRRYENSSEGGGIVTEQLSWYRGGRKLTGKIIKPCGEKGTFDLAFGARPLVMYVHDPMKVSAAEKFTKELVPMGVIGYNVACPEKAEDIVFLIKKMGALEYVDKDRIFLIADPCAADKTVNALLKAGRKTAGAVLLEPLLQGKAAVTVKEHEAELLVVSGEQRGNALGLITDYMEERGAFK